MNSIALASLAIVVALGMGLTVPAQAYFGGGYGYHHYFGYHPFFGYHPYLGYNPYAGSSTVIIVNSGGY